MKNPFAILKNLDITLILFFNGVVNAVYYAVTATISTLFAEAYPFLSETQVGLCFLSIGGGMFFGSLASGKILDWEFRKTGKNLDVGENSSSSEKTTQRLPETQKTGKYAANFPIEKVCCQVILSQQQRTLLVLGSSPFNPIHHGILYWSKSRIRMVHSATGAHRSATDFAVY